MKNKLQQKRFSVRFSLVTATVVIFFYLLNIISGYSQIPTCALVDAKTGNEIDNKNGFKLSEIPSMKVVVVGGKGEYRVALVVATLMRRGTMVATDQSMHSPNVPAPSPGPSLIQVGDKLIIKASKIFLKNADGKEEAVTVNNMQFVIPIH